MVWAERSSKEYLHFFKIEIKILVLHRQKLRKSPPLLQRLRFFQASEQCSSDKNLDLSDTSVIYQNFQNTSTQNLTKTFFSSFGTILIFHILSFITFFSVFGWHKQNQIYIFSEILFISRYLSENLKEISIKIGFVGKFCHLSTMGWNNSHQNYLPDSFSRLSDTWKNLNPCPAREGAGTNIVWIIGGGHRFSKNRKKEKIGKILGLRPMGVEKFIFHPMRIFRQKIHLAKFCYLLKILAFYLDSFCVRSEAHVKLVRLGIRLKFFC